MLSILLQLHSFTAGNRTWTCTSWTPEPKSGASANSAIPAGKISIPFLRVFVNLDDMLIGSGHLRSEGICADAARAHKRVDTCGFHPLVYLPFPLEGLAQTRDRRPLRNGERQSVTVECLSWNIRSSQIDYCYTGGLLYAGAAWPCRAIRKRVMIDSTYEG